VFLSAIVLFSFLILGNYSLDPGSARRATIV